MKQIDTWWMHNRKWLLAAVVVTGLSLLMVFAPVVRAADPPAVVAAGPAQSQVVDGDLEVQSGQTIQGDAVVYNGDVKVENGGTIAGNLTVYKGDVEIQQGGKVDGSITSWSGDVTVDGEVNGSVSAMSGDVEIGDAGVVHGDISVMSGRIKQRAGAEVGGSVLHGPNLKIPAAPMFRGLPWLQAPVSPLAPRELSMGERFLGFFGRLMVALLALAIAIGGASALMALREPWVMDVHGTLNRQAALSFAVGIIVNVLLLAVIGFLYITVCLRPPGLLLGVGMAALNVAGFAATGYAVGTRLESNFRQSWSPVARVAMGVLVPGVAIALLWVFGGCLSFFGFIALLIVSSFGVGAVLVRVLKLGTSPATTALVPAGPVAPAAAAPAPGAPAPAAPQPQAPAAAATDVASPVSSDRAATVPMAAAATDVAAGAPSESPVTPAWGEVAAAPEVVEPPAGPRVSEAAPSVVETPAAWGELAAPATGGAETVQGGDDFSALPGIGPKLSQRLKAAGVMTYADLAAMTPAALGELLGWSADRVVRSEIIERAQVLASSGR